MHFTSARPLFQAFTCSISLSKVPGTEHSQDHVFSQELMENNIAANAAIGRDFFIFNRFEQYKYTILLLVFPAAFPEFNVA
jgi:hypothetical protein